MVDSSPGPFGTVRSDHDSLIHPSPTSRPSDPERTVREPANDGKGLWQMPPRRLGPAPTTTMRFDRARRSLDRPAEVRRVDVHCRSDAAGLSITDPNDERYRAIRSLVPPAVRRNDRRSAPILPSGFRVGPSRSDVSLRAGMARRRSARYVRLGQPVDQDSGSDVDAAMGSTQGGGMTTASSAPESSTRTYRPAGASSFTMRMFDS